MTRALFQSGEEPFARVVARHSGPRLPALDDQAVALVFWAGARAGFGDEELSELQSLAPRVLDSSEPLDHAHVGLALLSGCVAVVIMQ